MLVGLEYTWLGESIQTNHMQPHLHGRISGSFSLVSDKASYLKMRRFDVPRRSDECVLPAVVPLV